MKLGRKVMFGIVVIVGIALLGMIITLSMVRESFMTQEQRKILDQKYKDNKKALTETFIRFIPVKDRGGADIAISIKYIMPLLGVGFFGTVSGNDLQVKQSELELMLSGNFPIDNVDLAKTFKDNGFGFDVNDRISGPALKRIYYINAKGKCLPEDGDSCQKLLADPSDLMNKQWTEEEKSALREWAGKLYTIVPDAPTAPSPSPSSQKSAAYSASCAQCTLINNQLSCSCDVIPR